MVITRLEKQKKTANRYSVYLDGDYAFSVFDNTLIKFALFESKTLSVGQIAEIEAFDLSFKCLLSAYNILSRRMQSEHELYYKLIKRYSNQEVVPTLRKLKELKYIDDAKFCEFWLESRQNSRGRKLLKQELLLKGINRDLIDRVFADHQESDDEKEVRATSILLKKYPGLEDLSRDEKYKKIYSLLIRRGFEYNVVSKIFQKYK